MKAKNKELFAFFSAHVSDDVSTECLLEMCRSKFGLNDVSEVVDHLKAGGILHEQNR